ncbi:aldehyde dehydrogenase [Amycolatopsis orientalis]|uniref:Aldehyde dehydrogenase n=1 Tax=Amycolatopsis orientalis TaxID=31958 RepID=A0A193BUC6_AMYOR|nr:aldehyde dehydrogenase family protein [Amycolatopsis orientalis]ANN15817.1 aldehyde dehydrogenase [Amycolatopsis orientalis]
MTTTQDLLPIDAVGVTGPYRTLRPYPLHDVTGQPVAALSLVPTGYVNRTMTALRATDKVAPRAERLSAIERAGRMFAEDVLGGLGPAEYQHLVSRTAGLPLSTVVESSHSIAFAAAGIGEFSTAGRPTTAVTDWQDSTTGEGRALWCRRGEILTVIAAGNHPSIHTLWLEALALGYRVVVRPSTREPFTPQRLVAALHAAGIERRQLVFLPTTHAQVDQLTTLADLAVVYGGDEVARKYSADPKVLVQGPGRSKILITSDVAWEKHLDVVVDSIAGHGGTACINTTAVLTEHDPAELADAVAQRLSLLRDLPPQDVEATLPVDTETGAARLAAYLERAARDARQILGSDGVATPLGDGSAVLRPALHLLEHPRARQLGTELPFPCAWFAPWKPADGTRPLRNSLVLTALTEREDLIGALAEDPTIPNLHVGARPTCWHRPGLPHDGFLSDFLMRAKAVSRA